MQQKKKMLKKKQNKKEKRMHSQRKRQQTKTIFKRHIKAYAWNEANWRFKTAITKEFFAIRLILPFSKHTHTHKTVKCVIRWLKKF